MKVHRLASTVIASLLISFFFAGILNIPHLSAAPSGAIAVEADNILELGDSEEVVVTFRNTASADITDVASTVQFVTLAAADLNPSRAQVALGASWEIYTSEAAVTPRVTGTVTGAVDTSAIYAPYSTTDPIYLYIWALGKPDGAATLDAYTNNAQFADDLRVLRPGEVLKLKITVQCQNVVGDSRIWFFFRATEFEPTTIPVADITTIPDAQRINLYYSKSPGPDKTPYWWPLHNSYDPYDSDIATGHVFEQVSWTRVATTTAFAKSNKLVHQKPQENPGVPCIDITKTGPAEAMKGENISYEFTVSNCGTVGLTNVTVNDTLLGPHNIPDLAVGASYTFNVTYPIPNDAPDPLVNVATASGWYGGEEVTDQDSHSVTIVGVTEPNPCINVTKTGPAEAQKGENITYEFIVSNCGNVGLTNVTVTDTLLGSFNIPDLAVGASFSFNDTYTVPGDAPDLLVNNATASGWYGGEEVTDQDSHSVMVKRSFSLHICGVKFRDLNGNGKYDVETEPGIDGVTITLFGADNATLAEEYYPELRYPVPEGNPLLSGENKLKGSYCFNINNATTDKEYIFYVREELPSGMIATTPTWIGPIELVASADSPRESLNNHFGNAERPMAPLVPALSQWGMIGMAALFAVVLVWKARKHSTAKTETNR